MSAGVSVRAMTMRRTRPATMAVPLPARTTKVGSATAGC